MDAGQNQTKSHKLANSLAMEEISPAEAQLQEDTQTTPKADLLAGTIGALGGPAVHILVTAMVYVAMSPVGAMSSADALAFVAFRAFPPLMLILWLSSECVALANIIVSKEQDQKPWNVESRFNTGSNPTWRTLLHRFQQNTMEQTLITVFTVSHLSQAFASAKPLDVRIAVAWAIAFVVGRIIFLLGYLNSRTPNWRFPGFIAGGFWCLYFCFLSIFMLICFQCTRFPTESNLKCLFPKYQGECICCSLFNAHCLRCGTVVECSSLLLFPISACHRCPRCGRCDCRNKKGKRGKEMNLTKKTLFVRSLWRLIELITAKSVVDILDISEHSLQPGNYSLSSIHTNYYVNVIRCVCPLFSSLDQKSKDFFIDFCVSIPSIKSTNVLVL